MEKLYTLAALLLGRRIRYLREGYYALRHAIGYRNGPFCCPCCSRRVRRFLPADSGIGGKVLGVRCPRCDSHPRHRLLWLYLHRRHTELFAQPLRLLHIAPEFCFARIFRQMKQLDYVTADRNSPFADVHLDLASMPFSAKAFDVIFCNHVLEHVEKDSLAMAELYRVLRPGGWAIVLVPLDLAQETTYEDARIRTPEERTRHYGQHDHVRQYGADFARILGRHGFLVEETDARSICDAAELMRYGIDPDERVFFAARQDLQS